MRPKFPPLARAASLLLVLSVSSAAAKTLYVAKAGDGSDGQSWESAYNSINAALIVSVTNDEIRITAETYSENIDVATPLTIVGGFESGVGESSLATGRTMVTPKGEGRVIELLADSELVNFHVTGGFGTAGVGVRAFQSTSTIRNCIMNDNGGGTVAGGVSCYKASLMIVDCTIANNTAQMEGGGVFCLDARVIVRDTLVSGNRCLGSPGDPRIGVPPQPGAGGGLSLTMSQAEISNCLFVENDAEVGSDLYYGGVGSLRCTNCTFGSTTFPNVRIGSSARGSLQIFNSILWGHEISFQGPQGIISYSNVRDGIPGDGNLSENPLFVDPDNGDFRLQAGSPCIDSASTSGPATDLDGNPRPFDVPGVGTEGPGAFDMGAYEFTLLPTPAPTFVNERSDIDGSDRVDAVDLLILLGDWMKSTGPSD